MSPEPNLASLPQPLQEMVANNWQRLLEAVKNAELEISYSKEIIDSLPTVFASSDYVAEQCIRDPKLLAQLSSAQPKPAEYHNLVRQSISDCEDEKSLNQALRQLRNQQMVQIAWADLAGWSDCKQTLSACSELAYVICEQTLDKLYQWQCERYDKPLNKHGHAQKLYIIAVGKLGGRELNFSSDIDLIFCYPEDHDSQQFFTRLTQLFIKTLNEITADGFVFRVDTRLRPYGDSGPIVMSFNALERYYQEQGRDWERYALVKARVIGPDDKHSQFINKLFRSFVYRRYVDYGVIESLRDMKRLLLREAKSKGLEKNVKKGPGGIREIEFTCQCFQLIRGGRDLELQEQNIFRVFALLEKWLCLNRDVIDELRDAYLFLRVLENHLQMLADQQTHDLPENELSQMRIAFSMQYASWDDLLRDLKQHKKKVEKHFKRIIARTDPETTTTSSTPLFRRLRAIWLNNLDHEEALALLEKHGFIQTEQAWQLVSTLKTSRRYSKLSQKARARLDILMPNLLHAVCQTEQPFICLQRSLHIIDAIMQRSAYLALLNENPNALQHLTNLCAASAWIAEFLGKHPLLLDELLDGRTLFHPLDIQELKQELSQFVHGVAKEDFEFLMDTLRRFRHIQILRVAAAEISNNIPLMKVSDHLTFTAEVILEQILQTAIEEVVTKYGKPKDKQGDDEEIKFIILGYGKFGGLELSYGSDLDLVFLYDGEDGGFYARLTQRMVRMLNTRTTAGLLYEVDLRLRPSGDSGLLVNHINSFTQYQFDSAWTWEHQALVRARAICGDPALMKQFDQTRSQVLTQHRDHNELREQVLTMRQKMRDAADKTAAGQSEIKNCPGGIIDIEFIVQYCALLWAADYPDVIRYTDNMRILDCFAENKLMSKQHTKILQDAYREFRAKCHRSDLQNEAPLILETEFAEQRQQVQKIWEQTFKE